MKNPYDVLGIIRTANVDDIKQAYRRLARTWHPDSNPDPRAEERFKEISAAYHLLADPTVRARFDRGEIDASGQERGAARASRRTHRSSTSSGFGTKGGKEFRFDFGFDDPPGNGSFFREDLFNDLFNKRQQAPAQRGGDATYELGISFVEAVRGGTRRVSLLNGKTLDVHISAGTEDGQKLRLKGQGAAGSNGGPNGDAIVEIKVQPHPFFVRKGSDIMVEVPVTLKEAVLGARITVPTVDGKVMLTVPKGSNSGTILRLKGKGIALSGSPGDQLVKLKILLPENIDLQLETFIKHWRPPDDEDPRVKAGLV
ncbi:MAG: Chaperone DnaJ [Rhodospirillaceae bacterium]|nr:MAG: Chaperone DnaJ [Rhodospirillaceae bacterium]